MVRNASCLLACWMVMAPLTAAAHSRLDSPTPRTQRDDYKDGNGGLTACLQDATTVPFTDLEEGQALTVRWTETINHPGCFLVSVRVGNTGDAWLDLANIKHVAMGTTPRPWSTTVQLPAGMTGMHSELLLRQIMLADETVPCPPSPLPPNVTYYSCADLNILAPDAGTESGADAGASPGLDSGAGPAPTSDAGAPGIPPPAVQTLGPSKITGSCGSGSRAGMLGLLLALGLGWRLARVV